MRLRNRKSAFTLIELLVVIAIIGLLLGLLLPAVQSARESGRRAKCANNLKQLALAVHNYESSFGYVPPQGIFPVGGTTNTWSAIARLLPFVEQGNLYDLIDFNRPYSTQPNISSQRIDLLICPDEQNDRGKANSSGVVAHWPPCYAANFGTWPIWNPVTGAGGDGAFAPTRGLKFAEFRDGLSNTLAFSEVRAYTSLLTKGGNPNVDKAPPPTTAAEVIALGGTFKASNPGTAGGHSEWVDCKIFETGFTTVFRPNTRVDYSSGGTNYDVDFVSANEGNTTNQYGYAAVTARSYHPLGVNACRMDASVQFVPNSIEPNVWRALGTRSGKEVNTNIN